MIGEVLDSHTTITFLWHYYISHTIYAVGVTVKYTEFFYLFMYFIVAHRLADQQVQTLFTRY